MYLEYIIRQLILFICNVIAALFLMLNEGKNSLTRDVSFNILLQHIRQVYQYEWEVVILIHNGESPTEFKAFLYQKGNKHD